MKIFTSYKQQLRDSRTSVIIFLSVFALVTCLSLVGILVSSVVGGGGELPENINIGVGFDVGTAVFVFINAMLVQEYIKFPMQNGVTRKHFHISRVMYVFTLYCALIVLGLIVDIILQNVFPNLHVSFFGLLGEKLTSNVFGNLALSLTRLVCFISIFSGLGIFLGSMNSRLNKNGKFLIYGLLLALVVLFFIIDANFFSFKGFSAIGNAIANLYKLNYFNALIGLGIFASFSALSWLFIRRAEFK